MLQNDGQTLTCSLDCKFAGTVHLIERETYGGKAEDSEYNLRHGKRITALNNIRNPQNTVKHTHTHTHTHAHTQKHTNIYIHTCTQTNTQTKTSTWGSIHGTLF